MFNALATRGCSTNNRLYAARVRMAQIVSWHCVRSCSGEIRRPVFMHSMAIQTNRQPTEQYHWHQPECWKNDLTQDSGCVEIAYAIAHQTTFPLNINTDGIGKKSSQKRFIEYIETIYWSHKGFSDQNGFRKPIMFFQTKGAACIVHSASLSVQLDFVDEDVNTA